jgi:NAD dependent epimerase/dehydratase family enzyme
MNAEESVSVRNYRCSLHPEVFRVLYFSTRNGGTFSQLIRPRTTQGGKVGKGRDGFLWHKVYGQVNFTPTRLLQALAYT